jgi:hypothetical protein
MDVASQQLLLVVCLGLASIVPLRNLDKDWKDARQQRLRDPVLCYRRNIVQRRQH